jgi:hypothetical protein
MIILRIKQFNMKRYLLGFLLTLILSVGANAQNLNLGVKGGLNVYNISGGDQYTSNIGIHFGLLSHIHLTDRIAVQPELLYSHQGTNISNIDTKLNLNYINVPVLFQYMFDNGFRVQAGPQLGFLVAAKTIAGDVTTNVMDDYERVDLGLGIGASYINPGTGLGIDVRYNQGLTNIGPGTASFAESTNRGFQIGLFFLFQHGD